VTTESILREAISHFLHAAVDELPGAADRLASTVVWLLESGRLDPHEVVTDLEAAITPTRPNITREGLERALLWFEWGSPDQAKALLRLVLMSR